MGLLYKGAGGRPMSVIAPITALLSAAVPVIAGYAEGERPRARRGRSAWRSPSWRSCWCRPRAAAPCRPSDLRRHAFALGAGLGFGFFFVFLSHTGEDAGMWPSWPPAARGDGRRQRRLLGFIPHAPIARGRRELTAAAGPSTPSPTSSTSSPCEKARQRRLRPRRALPGEHRRAPTGPKERFHRIQVAGMASPSRPPSSWR